MDRTQEGYHGIERRAGEDCRCDAHDRLVDANAELSKITSEITEGLGWIKSLGKLTVTMLGGLIITMIPLMVAFMMFQANIDKRVSAHDEQIKGMREEISMLSKEFKRVHYKEVHP
jgi:hypothetical protein